MAIDFFNFFGRHQGPPPLPVAPPPLPKAPTPVGQADTYVPTTPLEKAVAANYAQYGSTAYDLKNRDQVRELLSHSPQLDNNPSTRNDENRCVGASLVALSLLDGNPQANANALRKTAAQFGVSLNEAQNSALEAMGQGHLTPNQATHLQELALKTAGLSDGRENPVGEGAVSGEIGATLSALRANDGLTTLKTATVNSEMEGGGSGRHATATAVDQDGKVVSYDPWPKKRTGQAPLADENTSPQNSEFLDSRFTVNNGADGSASLTVEKAVNQNGKYRMEGSVYDDNIALQKTNHPILPGEPVASGEVGEGPRTFIDPKTGKAMTPRQTRKVEELMANPSKKEASVQGMGEAEAVGAEPGETPAGITAQTGHPASPVPAEPESRSTVTHHETRGVNVAPLQTDATGTIAAKEARAEVSALNKQVSYQSKNVQAQAGVKVGEVAAYAGASASVDLKNLKINAEVHAGVEANLVDAQASARVKLGNIGDVGGDARARVGADALGQAGVGFDPKHGTIDVGASGEAFTGARANAGVNANLGPVGVHAGVAAQVGVGIQAGVDVGMKNGKLHFNLDFGFSLGIGIRFNLGFSIDFKAIGKGIVKGLKAIGKGVKKLGKALAKGAKKMKKAAKKAVKWMGHAAKKATKKLKKLGKKVGKKLKHLFGRHKHKHHHHKKVEHKADHKVAPPAKVAHHHHLKALSKVLQSHGHHSGVEHVA
ncbi:hypothetical protein JST97_34145 [bacterium]|nr:hypothetical protein [bacterium]